MSEKLKFTLAEPEHVVIPMKMDREKWFAIAHRNNEIRVKKLQRAWPDFQMEEVWTDLYA